MKGKLIAFLLPVVYVFTLLLVVSPSSVSAHYKPDDGEWRDSSSCIATACGSSIGEKEQTYFDKVRSERCETKTFTYSDSANGSWANCPTGYEISGRNDEKCVKKEMRYADYKGNPWLKQCSSNSNDYTSRDSRKPCSMLVIVDTKDRVWVPKTVTVDVAYGLKSNDRNKCHRPTAESLNIPSYARHSYYTMLPEFIRDSIVEYNFVETEFTKQVACNDAEIEVCPDAGVCPTNCGYAGGDEVADGEGGTIVCPAIEACPAEGVCPATCGYEGGEVADGEGGYKVCPAIAACPVDDEGEVQGVTDEVEVKGTTDVVLADTGASDNTLVYLVEGILVLGTLVSSAMFVKKYAI